MRLQFSISFVAIDALLNQNCSTPDAAAQCASHCDHELFDCAQHCPPSDASCHSECTRQRAQCEERCPCLGELCWSGCPCTDNPQQAECQPDVDFVAVSPVSTGSHHLLRWIGKSHRSWTVDFEPKLTKTADMCGVVVKGQLFLFGGGKGSARAAYHVVGCHLQPMLPLGFSFDYGICSATEGGTSALLCSPHTSGTDCWKFNGLGFSKTARLLRSHTDGAVADAYGTLTVVAGGNTLDVEQYDPSSARWFVASDMKAVLGDHLAMKYTYFSLAAINHRLFCFGGMQGSNSPVSMVYTMNLQTKEWSHYAQSLATPRAKHRTLMIGANVLLIGGQTSPTPDRMFSAEKWTVSHSESFAIESARWPEVVLGGTLASGSNFEGIGVDDPLVYQSCVKLPVPP